MRLTCAKSCLAGLLRHDEDGAGVLVLQLGHQQPHRGGDAGMQRRDRVLRADDLGERDRVQRAGAAEAHQREVARIDALGDRIGVDRQRHVVVDDAQDAERRVLRRKA